MAAAKPNFKRMAKEASAARNYVMAAEILTQAINVVPATAGLYADRASALIMLGSYAEAIVDANKCIHLDPSMARGYIRKCAALMKLKQYRAAKAVLELGSSCTNDKSKFVWLLDKCEKFIAEEPDQSQDAPMCLIKPKYRYYYYNKPTEVILAICVMGVPADSITVHFGEQMLNVSIDIPGEEKYQLQPQLPSKIIPERCTYEILPNEVVIHLEKADQSYWDELLPQSSLSMCEDKEFSWITARLHGQDILPHVRDQKATNTCVFQAVSGTAEIELKRKGANRNPPESCDVRFCTEDFIEEYERLHGAIGSDDTRRTRLKTALSMFKEEGVTAEGSGVPKAKYKIQSLESRRNSSFRDIVDLIEEGRPVLGSLRLETSFKTLKPGEIYDCDPDECMKTDDGVHISHAIVFIGHGVRGGRAYLVIFLNSFGTDFCDEGFGRVFFDRVRRLIYTTIDIDI